jgi:sugar O-acyltransferase (sialic acid O-acetyltransferase NeuD family)
MTARGLLILGFGGHARSVGDVALDLGIEALAFVATDARSGEEFAGFPVRSTIPEVLEDGWTVFPAAGSNTERQTQVEEISTLALPLDQLVSKRAYVGAGAIVLPGTFIAHHSHVGPMASIGRGVIINTAAVVDHESVVGDFSHIAINATVAGRCRIGRRVFVGAGATVIDRVSIVDDVVIGAGAAVIDNIAEPGVYVGCPARRLGS